jgi:hypothetical protein
VDGKWTQIQIHLPIDTHTSELFPEKLPRE